MLIRGVKAWRKQYCESEPRAYEAVERQCGAGEHYRRREQYAYSAAQPEFIAPSVHGIDHAEVDAVP